MYAARHRLGIDARHVGFGPTSQWMWEAVSCIDGDADVPKTARPEVHTVMAFFAENGNISGLEQSSPTAFFAIYGEGREGESDAPHVTTPAMDPEIFPKTAKMAKNAAVDVHQGTAFLGATVDADGETGE